MMTTYRIEGVLTEFHQCMSKTLDEVSTSDDILCVNDGSKSRILDMPVKLGGCPTEYGRLSLAEPTC